jgi:WD40 repeat protein
VRIWDPHTGQTRHTLTGHTADVTAMAVAPDGSWLATGSSYGGSDDDMRIWDPHTGHTRHTLTGAGSVTAMAVAPDGTWLATVARDATVRVWDVEAGGALMSLRAGHALRHIAIDGRRVVVAGERGPYVFSLAGCM